MLPIRLAMKLKRKRRRVDTDKEAGERQLLGK